MNINLQFIPPQLQITIENNSNMSSNPGSTNTNNSHNSNGNMSPTTNQQFSQFQSHTPPPPYSFTEQSPQLGQFPQFSNNGNLHNHHNQQQPRSQLQTPQTSSSPTFTNNFHSSNEAMFFSPVVPVTQHMVSTPATGINHSASPLSGNMISPMTPSLTKKNYNDLLSNVPTSVTWNFANNSPIVQFPTTSTTNTTSNNSNSDNNNNRTNLQQEFMKGTNTVGLGLSMEDSIQEQQRQLQQSLQELQDHYTQQQINEQQMYVMQQQKQALLQSQHVQQQVQQQMQYQHQIQQQQQQSHPNLPQMSTMFVDSSPTLVKHEDSLNAPIVAAIKKSNTPPKTSSKKKTKSNGSSRRGSVSDVKIKKEVPSPIPVQHQSSFTHLGDHNLHSPYSHYGGNSTVDEDSPSTIPVSSPQSASSMHSNGGLQQSQQQSHGFNDPNHPMHSVILEHEGDEGDVTVDDILSGDPFEDLSSSSPDKVKKEDTEDSEDRKSTDALISEFIDFDCDEKSEDIINGINTGKDKGEEISSISSLSTTTSVSKLSSINEKNVSSTSIKSVKKKPSIAKINKNKVLKKSYSFSGNSFNNITTGPTGSVTNGTNTPSQTTTTITSANASTLLNSKMSKSQTTLVLDSALTPQNNNGSNNKRPTIKPNPSISFSECSQRIPVFALGNHYSFVYENLDSLKSHNGNNGNSNYNNLRKTKSSQNFKSLSHNSQYQYDYYNSSGDDSKDQNSHMQPQQSPRVLKSMKAGLIEFQIDLNKKR